MRRWIDEFVGSNEWRILVWQIIDPVGFHEARNAICGTNHRIPCPHRIPMRLPSQAETRLEVSDSGVGVVSRSNCRCPGDQIEIHILTVVGLARSCQLITKAQVQREIVFDAPVVLGEYPEQTVAQVFGPAPAISLLNILRETEHEVGNRIAG